ncbi:MAG: hypothetical protein WCF57_14125, partial [Pyrinomonadaceae bacterium]
MDATSRAPSSTLPPRALQPYACALAAFVLLLASVYSTVYAQQQPGQDSSSSASAQLNPVQREIERERRRLASSDREERRDAVMRLGWMARTDSSRVAASALRDPD